MFLVIGWIIFSNVKAAGRGLEKAAKSVGKSDEWRKNISTIQARQKRLQAAAKSKALKQARGLKSKPREQGRGADYGLNARHAPQKDQNRHRRDDWGARGGEIITTQSLLVLLALGLIVLYVLSKISPSDLGL